MRQQGQVDDIAAFANELASAEYDVAPAVARTGGAAEDAAPPPTPTEPSAGASRDLVMQIPVTVKVVLGSATMPVSALTRLQRGALIPLDRKVGEAVDIVVNGRLIARGEIVVIDEATAQFGVTLTELAGPGPAGLR